MSIDLRIDRLALEGDAEAVAEQLGRALERLDPGRRAAVVAAVVAELARRQA